MLDATYTLGACLLLCEVSQKSIRGISRYLGISTKRVQITHEHAEDWTECRQACYFFDVSRVSLLLIQLVIDPHTLYNRLNTSRLARFRKNRNMLMKRNAEGGFLCNFKG